MFTVLLEITCIALSLGWKVLVYFTNKDFNLSFYFKGYCWVFFIVLIVTQPADIHPVIFSAVTNLGLSNRFSAISQDLLPKWWQIAGKPRLKVNPDGNACHRFSCLKNEDWGKIPIARNICTSLKTMVSWKHKQETTTVQVTLILLKSFSTSTQRVSTLFGRLSCNRET